MLNTQKFNIGKFNVIQEGTGSEKASATFIANSGMSAAPAVFYASSARVAAESLLTVSEYVRIKQAFAQEITAESGMSAEYYKRILVTPLPIDAISGMTAQTASVFGIDILSLPQIVLKPGQELIINTDDMTVTVDGENVIHLLSDDSVFFFLAQGEDIITYSDVNGSRSINFKVMYKNRWL